MFHQEISINNNDDSIEEYNDTNTHLKMAYQLSSEVKKRKGKHIIRYIIA